jgi:membrane associated rhomboid family serine protease
MFERRRVTYASSPGPGGFGIDLSLTPWVKRLLIANTAIFLAMALGLLPPGWAVRTLGFAVPDLLVHPWSPVTYMFLHGGFWHLFMNMLAVFFFGPPLERKWGGRFFAKYYLVAGLGGALFSLLLYPVIGASLMIGASGAVFGLLLAFAMNWPDAPIYIWGILPIRAKWFVGILGFFALFATISGSGDGVAHWAHLGGLATGYVYLRYGGQFGRNVSRLIWKETTPEVRSDVEVVRAPRAASTKARSGRRRGGRTAGDSLDRVDQILDKIRENGIDSLSTEERAFLDDMSRRYREGPERTFH